MNKCTSGAVHDNLRGVGWGACKNYHFVESIVLGFVTTMRYCTKYHWKFQYYTQKQFYLPFLYFHNTLFQSRFGETVEFYIKQNIELNDVYFVQYMSNKVNANTFELFFSRKYLQDLRIICRLHVCPLPPQLDRME